MKANSLGRPIKPHGYFDRSCPKGQPFEHKWEVHVLQIYSCVLVLRVWIWELITAVFNCSSLQINSLSPGCLLPFIYFLRRKLSLTYPTIGTGAMAVTAGQLAHTKFIPSPPPVTCLYDYPINLSN